MRGTCLAWILTGAALATASARGEGTAPAVDADGAYARQSDVVYTPPTWAKSLKADLYVPEGPGPFPAVIVVHGGGWIIGGRIETAAICRRLARHGFVAMNVEYRLLPEFPFPAALRDVQQALRWMRAHAAAEHIDPQRIGAWGYSAGAQLAALMGTLSPGDAFYAGDARVGAVVAGGTPADLRTLAKSSLVQDYLGGALADRPQRYVDASPTALASAGDAPAFLYAGEDDALVPPQNTKDLKAALDAAGVPAEVFWVPGRGHLSAFVFDDAAVSAAIGFLDRYLKAPP